MGMVIIAPEIRSWLGEYHGFDSVAQALLNAVKCAHRHHFPEVALRFLVLFHRL